MRLLAPLAVTLMMASLAAPARAGQVSASDGVPVLTGSLHAAGGFQAPGVQPQVAPVPQLPAEKPAAASLCGQPVPPPAALPPEGSPPVVYALGPCFTAQGGTSAVEPATYLFYIQTRPSRPSQGIWVPYDEKSVLEDFTRLWNTGFLNDLSIEVNDYVFQNGVVGKLITYHMEERERIKIVDYEGSKQLDQTKIEEKLREEEVRIPLDSFVDPAKIRRVQDIVRQMLGEKGFQAATVTHKLTPMAGGPKLVHLTFHIDEGPKVRIRDVEFVGNQAIGDFWLKRQMKSNQEQWFLSFITGRGTFQEAKFEEDADNVLAYYRNKGYMAVRIGEPDLKDLEDSKDRRTRWVQLRVPVQEGARYRVGDVTFDGNTIVKTEALRSLFKMKPGEWYSEKDIRKGMEKARELYGSVGYFDFNLYPDLAPRDMPARETGDDAQPGPGDQEVGAAPKKPVTIKGAPVVDVTMRLNEGKQYFVNRITFQGNTTTRDNVIRREIRLVEGGVFNTEALKYSIKRINQLGYFKTIEGDKELTVEKTPNADNKLDVTLKVEEQNRNQITFGAGVSQWEGFFGQLSFQTANFLGRGETFSVMLQAGSLAQNYQVAFTEPFLFDRAITAGIDLYRRDLNWINYFTQSSVGGNLVFGLPLRDFTRLFVNYSLEQTRVKDVNDLYLDETVLATNPYLKDTLLIGAGGRRTISKITPSLIHNTVDNPLFPTAGKRFTASVDLAGIGGDTAFVKPMIEGVLYIPHTRRTSVGMRAQFQYLGRYNATDIIPIYERLFLGGEYSVRGFDIRSIGPKAPPVTTIPTTPVFEEGEWPLTATYDSQIVIGGNKSLLFNAEYLISIAGPVRLVLFFDAGQARDFGERFAMDQFKTSTGAEVRFFMPVLNVPFRLIMAYNPHRSGVLDNNYQPQKAWSFRFAVGSTF
ncbi:MAG: outer membrane protein assembly factor BamA [Vicinamibacterales bacterium]